MHESIWERSLFTSECRTDSCAFYITQSCDVTQNHTAPATFSCSRWWISHKVLCRAAFVTDTSADQQDKMAADCREVVFGNLCEIWPSSRVKHTLAVSPHARPVCFHLNNSWLPAPVPWNDPALTSVSVLMGWSGCCLRRSFNSFFCNNYEAVSNCLWAKHSIKRLHSRYSAGIWMHLRFHLSTIVSSELELFYYVRRKYDIKDKGNLSTEISQLYSLAS